MTEARLSLIEPERAARVRCCVDGRFDHRLLARFTCLGLHVWCAACHGEHLVSWDRMEQLRHWLTREPSGVPLATSANSR